MPEYAEMQHNMMTTLEPNNDVLVYRRVTVRFYPSHRLVCGIEFSHIGKKSVNPDLVCKSMFSQLFQSCGQNNTKTYKPRHLHQYINEYK